MNKTPKSIINDEDAGFQVSLYKLFLLSLLFIIFYLTFILSADTIHHIGNPTDLNNILPWQNYWLTKEKGIEMYFLALATPTYFILGYFITRKFNNRILSFSNKIIVLCFLLAIISILIYNLNSLTKDTQNSGMDNNLGYFSSGMYFFGLFIIVSIIVITIYLSKLVLSGTARKILLFGFFLSLVFLGLLIKDASSLFEYGYYIGPANKILQGEKLGSFYIQYNLINTYLFVIMQKINLQFHQMQNVYVIIFSFWILLYYKISSMIFKNKTYVYLFLFALLITRLLAVLDGPISIPRVSPMRLDLWVPLLFFILHFGFRSLYTALSFSICYIADDVFGLMYLCLFILTIIYIFIHELIKSNRTFAQTERISNNPKKEIERKGSVLILSKRYRPANRKPNQPNWRPDSIITLKMKDFVGLRGNIKKMIIILLPVLIVLAIHYLIFRTIGTPTSKIYTGLNFGFIPISIHSSFWLIAWVLPVCLYILSQSKQNKIIYLFLFGIACIQLIYFFGRSQENYLRNISGILIFIIFLALDHYYSHTSKKRIILYFTILSIVGLSVSFRSQIIKKYENAKIRIQKRSLFESDTIDNALHIQSQCLKSIPPDKIIVISRIDSYINYRLGYDQIGYFAPFNAHIYKDETITFLTSKLKQDYRLIIFPEDITSQFNFKNYIPDFNSTPLMIANKEQFFLEPLGNDLWEIRLAKI